MATRSASSASAMAGRAVDRTTCLELRDASAEALLGPRGLLGGRGSFLLDAVDAPAQPAAGEALRRPGAVALDPHRGERRVRVAEGELPHLLARRSTRHGGACHPDGRGRRRGSRARPCAVGPAGARWHGRRHRPASAVRVPRCGGVAGEDGEVLVLEECDERLEVDVVGPKRRVGGPHESRPSDRRPRRAGDRAAARASRCPGRRACLRIRTAVRTSAAVEGSCPAGVRVASPRLAPLTRASVLADQAVVHPVGRELRRQLRGMRGQIPTGIGPVGGHQGRTRGRSTESRPAAVRSSGTSTGGLTS